MRPDGLTRWDGSATRRAAIAVADAAIEWMQENQMAEMIQAQLRDVGIDVNVQLTTYAAEWEMASNCEHDMAACGSISAIRTTWPASSCHPMWVGIRLDLQQGHPSR